MVMCSAGQEWCGDGSEGGLTCFLRVILIGGVWVAEMIQVETAVDGEGSGAKRKRAVFFGHRVGVRHVGTVCVSLMLGCSVGCVIHGYIHLKTLGSEAHTGGDERHWERDRWWMGERALGGCGRVGKVRRERLIH